MTKHFVREATIVYGEKKIEWPSVLASASDVDRFARPLIANLINEVFLVIAVNSRHRPQAWSIVSTGTTTSCVVSPADVFRFVLMTGCERFFVAHNHPSGDAHPSAEDLVLTRALKSGASLLGMKLIDHVVLGDSYYSFMESGTL